ncbi:MAG: 30S ribosome-binding factor RbfA [Rhodobacteraceae bacterium]|nr:30S ribosome-binding factor RbfA [Paracoccaceae bacterium]
MRSLYGLAKRHLSRYIYQMSKRKTHRDGQDGGGAPSQRQLKVGESIRRTLSDVLMRGETHDPELTRFSITVSEVRASPDLRHATAFVLPLGGKDADAALAALKKNTRELRHQVTKSLTLKYSPELHFVLDESFDRMDAANRLLNDEQVRRDVATDREE